MIPHILFIISYLQMRLLLPCPRLKAGGEGNCVDQWARKFYPLNAEEASIDRASRGALHAHQRHSICI